MANKIIKLSKEDAGRRYPGYRNKPNISATGSIRGMRKLYGWKGLVIRVGGFYYLIGT